MLSVWGGCPNLAPNVPAQGELAVSWGRVCITARWGTHGTRWSWSTLAAAAQRQRASPPVPPRPQNETSLRQHGCLGAAEKYLRSPWPFATGSSANCLLPATFPWVSAQTGRTLLEQAKPQAGMSTVLSPWSFFLYEAGKKIEQHKPLL